MRQVRKMRRMRCVEMRPERDKADWDEREVAVDRVDDGVSNEDWG